MACDDKKAAFEAAILAGTKELEAGLASIGEEAARKAKELSDEFEKGNDLAEGVGAAAGTVVGGVFGGPAGAAAGGEVGKAIGALFMMRVEMRRTSFKLDVPETTIRDQEWLFDTPVVILNDKAISFDLPVPVMRRVRGPDIPRLVCRMETRDIGLGVKLDVPVCYNEMEPSYFDVPSIEMRRQDIVVGMPEVRMQTQRIVVGVPEITMKTQEMSFDVPFVSLELVADAGKRTADAAKLLAEEAQTKALTAEASLREQLRFKVSGPCNAMFECFRGELRKAREQTAGYFDPQITQLGNSLAALAGKGVPEGDPEVVNLKITLEKLIKDRDAAVAQIDKALQELNDAAAKAMDQFINKDPEEQPVEALAA
jgi:hypothetical protein